MDNILKKISEEDELKLRDDDHLDKTELTEKEADQGFKELVEKYKDQPKIKDNPANKFSKGVIDALNKLSTLLILHIGLY